MDNSETISDFQGASIQSDEYMQIVTEYTCFNEESTAANLDIDMSEVDSSEIAAVVCGVPVMIPDCEQDIDMQEKEFTSFVETNLKKDDTNMLLHSCLTKETMIETSDCENFNKMNQLQDIKLCDTSFDKNCIDMELETSKNEKCFETSNVDSAYELNKSTVVEETVEKNKLNSETVSNNNKIAEVLNFDIITEIQGDENVVSKTFPEKESIKMEIENYASEKMVAMAVSSTDAENLEKTNSCKIHSNKEESKNSESASFVSNKEMSHVSGDTWETEKRVKKAKFYAVALPKSFFETENSPCIFTSKTDALAAIKKYPGARFMQFDAIEDAIKYSSNPVPVFTAQSILEEKPSKYKSISSQQMVALRRTIEKGDEAAFLDTVWSNPRYLINNAGDGPTIMQEGTRYNALHVAARFKQSAMCLTILNTIQDCQFMSLLYPQEDLLMIENHISRLVDLYLNTPDKSLSETPLHFACKFGADEILSILLSYKECDIHRKNKYGLTPQQMICDRTSHHPEEKEKLKDKMNSMFEDLFYVPILRDLQNNFKEPIIGKPCCSNIFLASTSSELTYDHEDLVYCAFAGPMSKSAADNFYALLKKRKFAQNLCFTPEEKKQLVDICLSDSEKGLERIGRKLAKELDVGWIEFWPALQFWGDFCNEGLEFLEKKLKSHLLKNELSPKSSTSRCENLKMNIVDFVNDFARRFPEIMKNKNRMNFFVLFQTLIPHLNCLAKSSFSETKELYMIHNEIGRLLYLKLVSIYKKYFEDFKFYLNKQFHTLDNILKSHANDAWKMFICILKCMCYNHFSEIKSLKPPKCSCKWNIQKKFYYSSFIAHKFILNECENYAGHQTSSNHVLLIAELNPSSAKPKEKDNAILVPFQNLSLDVKVTNSGDFVVEKQMTHSSALELSVENANDDIFYLSNDSIEIDDDENVFHASGDKINYSGSSAKTSSLEDTDDELEGFYTPPESPVFKEQELFVKGVNAFSDVDIDIFRAIVDGGAKINQNEYPNVFEWKCLIESKLKSLLNPHDKLSCTPASSSASLRRAITPVDRVRRTLF